MFGARSTPTFEIRHEEEPGRTLLVGLSEFGLAGLTAVDYLVDQVDLAEIGHIHVDQLPTITPFEDGTPRHHTRLFSGPDAGFTALVGELFVPAWAAEPFGSAVLDWTERAGVEEVVVLSGVPTAHGPDDHRAFYVASQDYQRARLDDAEVEPMPGGFLDGVNGALMARGVDSPLRVCVFTTPVHPQAPDAEAALRLLDALDGVYDFDLDTGPLEAFADELSRYYEEIAARMEALREETEVGHDDRMYM